MHSTRAVLSAALFGACAALASPWVFSVPRAGADPAPSGPPDFASVVERVRPGVVHVWNFLERPRDVPDPGDPTSRDENVGSGFVWSSDGWIVTNFHVTAGARLILVEIEGRGWLEATLKGEDKVADVALLKVDATGLVALTPGDPRSLRVGQWVLAAGSPERLARSFSHGIVSGLERSDTGANPSGYEDFIQTDAAVNVGGSGGPLFDASGRVVGMNTAILTRSFGFQGVSLSVPIDVVLQTAEMLRARGVAKRPTLGVVLRGVDPLKAIRLPGGGGLSVTGFAEESSAKRAGLQKGDVILSVDGTPTKGRGTLQRIVWSKGRGAVVSLRYWRQGQVYDAQVRLDD